jgi:hypothetical protein
MKPTEKCDRFTEKKPPKHLLFSFLGLLCLLDEFSASGTAFVVFFPIMSFVVGVTATTKMQALGCTG